MGLSSTLFPAKNREAALVAGLRTFWQALTGAGIVGGGSAIVVTATGIAGVDWETLAYGAAGVLLSAVIAAARSAGNILTNGLPTVYTGTTATDSTETPAAQS